jgi:NAD(P)-dependent dehydrogenase (short-subunit alcohol dehydrogenase family)
MTFQSQPKTALITGAGDRLGKAMALALADAGYAVGVHVNRSVVKGAAVVEEIVARGGRAVALQADLTDRRAVDALIGQATEALGTIGVLVNNASLFEDDSIADMTPETWDAHQTVNLYAPVRLAQSFAAALPGDRHGVVVNMIDQRVWKIAPTFLSYTASKVGLWHMTKSLAQALAPRIRVVGIGPGPTMQNVRQEAHDFEAQRKATLLETGAAPDDICGALLYLVGASAVTGQMIAVDGGQHLIWRTPDIDGVVE